MQQAERPSEEEIIEMLVFNKKDILEKKIDIEWVRSNEFKYNGEMYDVVKKEEDSNRIFLYCIHDEKEKRLEEDFEKRVHKNTTEDKQHPITTNYYKILLSEPVLNEQISIALVYECEFNFWRTGSYNSPYLDIPSPPPKLT